MFWELERLVWKNLTDGNEQRLMRRKALSAALICWDRQPLMSKAWLNFYKATYFLAMYLCEL
jgi:hypothetical protein